MSNDLSELPEGWAITTVSDVVLIEMGQSPDGSATNTTGNGLPLIGGASDLGENLPHPTRYTSTPTKVSEIGDLILCVRATIGKLNYADDHYCLGRGVAGLRPIIFERDWLRYYLNYSAKNLDQAGTGTTFRQIDKATLQNWSIPFAPLNEQGRIVAKIEALKARSQQVKEALEEARQLENTLVAYYTTGWAEGELGSHIKERNELAGEYWHKYPVVGLSNEGCITERREPIGEKSAPRCKVVCPGDIVFNPIRFSIGSIARYRGTDPAIVSPEYQVFRTNSTMSAELLCRYLRSKPGQSRLEIETQGSVRYRVYLRNLRRLIMPIAPPERQAEAEQFFVCLNKTFEAVKQALSAIPELEQSILAKAFRGELVPQDPNDEPASVLLERIRAERAKREAEAKAAKKSTGKTTGQRSRKAKQQDSESIHLGLPGVE